jgi:hypothetical protein
VDKEINDLPARKEILVSKWRRRQFTNNECNKKGALLGIVRQA